MPFFYYSYIAFMINALKNESMSFLEIMKLKLNLSSKISLVQKQMINYFEIIVSIEFNLVARQIQNKKKVKIIDTIHFDEQLEICEKQIRNSLHLKQSLLEIIEKDYIDLKFLVKHAELLQKNKKELLLLLKKLISINNTSALLQLLCEIFQENLTNENIFLNNIELNDKITLFQNQIPQYTQDSASIFISLAKNLGQIQKVSKNFNEVVPIVQNSEDAIGMSINCLMSDEIADQHDQILLKHLNKKQFNEDITGFPILIGKTLDGWAIPFQLKVQNFILNNSEFGTCARIKQIQDNNMHIATSSVEDNLKIYLTDSKFYDAFFRQIFTQNQVYKIKLGYIAPLLKQLILKGRQGIFYDILLIQPSSLQDSSFERDIYSEEFIPSLFKSNLFLCRISTYPIIGEIINIVQLQISFLISLSDLQQKKNAIRNFVLLITQYSDPSKFKKPILEIYNSLNQNQIYVGLKDSQKQQFKNQDSSSSIQGSLKNYEDTHIKTTLDQFETISEQASSHSFSIDEKQNNQLTKFTTQISRRNTIYSQDQIIFSSKVEALTSKNIQIAQTKPLSAQPTFFNKRNSKIFNNYGELSIPQTTAEFFFIQSQDSLHPNSQKNYFQEQKLGVRNTVLQTYTSSNNVLEQKDDEEIRKTSRNILFNNKKKTKVSKKKLLTLNIISQSDVLSDDLKSLNIKKASENQNNDLFPQEKEANSHSESIQSQTFKQ